MYVLGLGMGWEDWVRALPIIGESGVCVLVAVVWVVLGGSGLVSWASVW